MFDPSSPKNPIDLVGTFIGGMIVALILYVIFYIIINGGMFLIRLFA